MGKKQSTKELLICSAGELFAENGLEGVTTRMIADKAGVKLSAIHYHFGSKNKLYMETCLAAHSRVKRTTFAMVLSENPNLINSREGQAEIIRTTVFRSFHDIFREDRPKWETKILLREIVAPTSAMSALIDIIFRPDTESAASFYKQICPEATDEEASAWSDMLYGQMLFYSIARNTVEMIRGEGYLNSTFYQTVAAKLARAMILETGLPLPNDLKK